MNWRTRVRRAQLRAGSLVLVALAAPVGPVVQAASGSSTQSTTASPTGLDSSIATLAAQIATLDGKVHDGGLAQDLAAPVLTILSSPQFDWNAVLFGSGTLDASQVKAAAAVTPALSQLVSEKVSTQSQAVALINSLIAAMQAVNPSVQPMDVVRYVGSVVSNAPSEMFYLLQLPKLDASVLEVKLHSAFQGYLTEASPAIQSLFGVGGAVPGVGVGLGSGAGSGGAGTGGSAGSGGGGSASSGSGGAGGSAGPGSAGSGGGGSASSGSGGSGGSTGAGSGTGAGTGSGSGGSSTGAPGSGSTAGSTAGSGSRGSSGSSTGGGTSGGGTSTGGAAQGSAGRSGRTWLEESVTQRGGAWSAQFAGGAVLSLLAPVGSVGANGRVTVKSYTLDSGTATPGGARPLVGFSVGVVSGAATGRPLSLRLREHGITRRTLVYRLTARGLVSVAGAQTTRGSLTMAIRGSERVVLLTPPWFAGPSFPAHSPAMNSDQRALYVNGRVDAFAPAFVAHGTTYMPIWYVMRELHTMGVGAAWKAGVLTVSPPASAPVWLTNLSPGEGACSVVIDGVTVMRLDGAAKVNPRMGGFWMYVPIARIMPVLRRLGITSAWDGRVWAIGVPKSLGTAASAK